MLNTSNANTLNRIHFIYLLEWNRIYTVSTRIHTNNHHMQVHSHTHRLKLYYGGLRTERQIQNKSQKIEKKK